MIVIVEVLQDKILGVCVHAVDSMGFIIFGCINTWTDTQNKGVSFKRTSPTVY